MCIEEGRGHGKKLLPCKLSSGLKTLFAGNPCVDMELGIQESGKNGKGREF